MMKLGKRGVEMGTIKHYIVYFVLLVVLFKIIAGLYPTAVAAGNDLNDSGAPLGSFFATGGVIWLVIFAALVIYVIIAALDGIKRSK